MTPPITAKKYEVTEIYRGKEPIKVFLVDQTGDGIFDKTGIGVTVPGDVFILETGETLKPSSPEAVFLKDIRNIDIEKTFSIPHFFQYRKTQLNPWVCTRGSIKYFRDDNYTFKKPIGQLNKAELQATNERLEKTRSKLNDELSILTKTQSYNIQKAKQVARKAVSDFLTTYIGTSPSPQPKELAYLDLGVEFFYRLAGEKVSEGNYEIANAIIVGMNDAAARCKANIKKRPSWDN